MIFRLLVAINNHAKHNIHVLKRISMDSHERAIKAANERWHSTTPVAPYNGILYLGDHEIPCDVLQDGTRLLRRKEFLKAMGRGKIGGDALRRSIDEKVPLFATANNLTAYLELENTSALSEIAYKLPSGKKVLGYKSTALPEACRIYLEARKDEVLNKQQLLIASTCESMMMAFAKVGLDALIDEATGYQKIRDKDALQKLLDQYVYEEVRQWTKRFPDEFFKQAYRIHGWQYPRFEGKNHPQYLGKFINKFVYDRLPPGVLEELKRKNPPNSNGNRQFRHHQFLTEDVGNEKLKQELNSVTTVMKLSDNLQDFKEKITKI